MTTIQETNIEGCKTALYIHIYIIYSAHKHNDIYMYMINGML